MPTYRNPTDADVTFDIGTEIDENDEVSGPLRTHVISLGTLLTFLDVATVAGAEFARIVSGTPLIPAEERQT